MDLASRGFPGHGTVRETGTPRYSRAGGVIDKAAIGGKSADSGAQALPWEKAQTSAGEAPAPEGHLTHREEDRRNPLTQRGFRYARPVAPRRLSAEARRSGRSGAP